MSCIVCQVLGEHVMCDLCKREIGCRETVIRYEKDIQTNDRVIRQAELQLAASRARERDLTTVLAAHRQQVVRFEHARAERTQALQARVQLFTTPDRGRERDVEVEEVAGPAGSAIPSGAWLNRRVRGRAAPVTVATPECMICLDPSEDGVESRCSREKCSFESCRTCWVKQAHVNGVCPACRYDIVLSDGEDEEE